MNQEITKIRGIIQKTFNLWKSPPKLTVSQWADDKRYLSPEASAEPGKYYTNRAEYQRGIMDAFSDPLCEMVVVMSSAQVGKTEILNNIVGYYVDQDPASILIVQPTVEMAQTWSKDRLAPMIRDNPCLINKVKDPKSKDSNNTILHKSFPGGRITVVGANSAAGLASRPIGKIFCDEVDRYPVSAGTEGDPVNLAIKRSNNYWNKKIGLFSTPTIKGLSRIEAAFENSDQRHFHIPCPHCGHEQKLIWGQIKYTDENPETAYYECAKCSGKINDSDRINAIKKGRWIATQPFKGIAGFHLNEFYSPWRVLANIVKDHLDAKGDPEKLKTWWNTSLGETWEDAGESLNSDDLTNKTETYDAQVPQGGIVLTCGVDVQDDRLELETTAWGVGEESWSVDYRVFYGNPDQDEVWQQLDDFLTTDFTHESGIKLRISATCVDTGGHKTQKVYEYGRKRYGQSIYLIKGVGGEGIPIVGAISKVKTAKSKKTVKLFPVGVDQAKSTIYGRLKIDDFGSGYMHFPKSYQKNYFDMLTAEKLITKFSKGFPKRSWVKIRARNEALDCRVYSYAALKILNPNFEKIGSRLSENSIKTKIQLLKQKMQNGSSAPITQSDKKELNLAEKVHKASKKKINKKSNFAKSWRH